MRSSSGLATGFDTWADNFAADWVRSNPLAATATQYFSGDEQDALDRKLSLNSAFGSPYGKRATDERAALARRGLSELARFDARSLSPEERTSAAIITWRLQDAIANAPFAEHRFVFTQMVGLHVLLIQFLTALHPIRNERDAENYLVRLRALAECLDEGVREAQSASTHGFLPPRFILERTIDQIDKLLQNDASDHTLVTSLRDRLQGLTLASARSSALCAFATREVEQNVVPALMRVRIMLVEQLAKADDSAGAWSLRDGEAYYRRQLATLAGTALSPREIHEIGIAEVARIESEMDALLHELGYADGTIAERLVLLNETLLDTGSREPQDAILAQLQDIVDDAAQRSTSSFRLRPAAPVTVRREPPFSERTAAAHYTPPAPDGSLPGVYWVPLAEIGPKVPWLGVGLKSTAYHEAIPGHHFQLAIEQESKALPRFRRLRAFGFDPPFGEGWALYAEHLAAESGWYDDDLPSRLGYLNMQAFRARRLVVDTGLHEFKWSRQRAIDYGLTVAEVERYVTWPGQACAYMLGQRSILAMRGRAEQIGGEAFSLKAFHDLILSGGTMPLEVLDQRVEAWAAAGFAAGSNPSGRERR